MKTNRKTTAYIISIIMIIAIICGGKTWAIEESVGAEEPPKEIEWTDFSTAQISLVKDNAMYRIQVKNVTFKENSTYYVLISNSETKPTGSTEPDQIDTVFGEYTISKETATTISINKYLEKAGDIHIWIYEKANNPTTYQRETKEVLSNVVVKRLPQLKVGNRIEAYFHNDKTSTFLHEPYDYKNEDNRKINIKIGHINNIEILKAIRDGKSNCLEQLLTYAKSEKAIYTGQVALGDSSTITDKFDVVDGRYYYVYMQMEEENGTYYPVEDVSLYQGLVGDTIGKNLYDYLSNEFKWNINEGNPNPEVPSIDVPQDNTVVDKKIPAAGASKVVMIAIFVILTMGVIFYIKYNRYKKIK